MFFKKKPKEPEKQEEPKYQNRLKIYFNDGGWLANTIDAKKDDPRIPPWKNFYKWYFSRPQSQYFMLKYSEGETLVIRDRIKQFNVSIKKVTATNT